MFTKPPGPFQYTATGPAANKRVVMVSEEGEVTVSSNIVLEDGLYTLTEGGYGQHGHFTVLNGLPSHAMLFDDEPTSALDDYFNTLSDMLNHIFGPAPAQSSSDQYDQHLMSLEALRDYIDGKIIIDSSLVSRGVTRDWALAKFRTELGRDLEFDGELRLRTMIDMSQADLEALGLPNISKLAIQLLRLRALLAWQPAELIVESATT